MHRLFKLLPLITAVSLSACASPQAERLVSAPAEPRDRFAWAFEGSDIPVDPGFRFGRLANGMRYVVRPNATPKGTAIVRMDVAAGSLDEGEAERGFAHYVEHMAFNGSARIPEGEMIKLLERSGLAFGADTNASTSFEQTNYKLDLPRNDPALLDTALMLMRETASALNFDATAVERERGVVLAEMRDRNSYLQRNALLDSRFLHPHAVYPDRFPIGTESTLRSATAQALRGFWAREYVPAQTTVFVIGDFDPVLVEAAIARHFASWPAAPAGGQPVAGPVMLDDGGRTAVHIDPALPDRLTATRHGPWLDERDTVAQRQENVLRQIGYGIVNRRLQRLSRAEKPPFHEAGLGTGTVFQAGRSTNIVIDLISGRWREGMTAAVREYRRALKFGFSKAEVAERVAEIRASVENAAASADTRSHGALEAAVYALVRDAQVPSHPQTGLERFEALLPLITPKRVLAALKREALPLDNPLLRYRGRNEPEGGAEAIRKGWDTLLREPVRSGAKLRAAKFAYTGFGAPGRVVADVREAGLGIRTLRFANGVMLNLKRTDLQKDRVLVQVALDGGERLNSRENPLVTELMQHFAAGGLGKHSLDELDSILAGRTVETGVSNGANAFVWGASTTPRDLELQLQVTAAYLTDPGYRKEGEVRYRHAINNLFARLRATPGSALSAQLGGILSDKDPRFTLQPVEAYRKLTFAGMRAAVDDRLAKGALEVALVGDFDEDAAIALVARTFGALPLREAAFGKLDSAAPRRFTKERTARTIAHQGPADQAMLRLAWPTRDDRDPVETITLALLERIVRLELTEVLRERLGKAYSPGASSAPSRDWAGYGTFTIIASVEAHDIGATRAAVLEALAALRDAPVDADTFARARQPMLEAQDNALKVNGGWMALTDRAQTEPERIDRYLNAKARMMALTPADVQAAARRYLTSDVLEITVVPEAAAAAGEVVGQ